MGAIDLVLAVVETLVVATLWLFGLAAGLAVLACLPPIRLTAAVDSLYVDEDNPLDWNEIEFRVRASGLLGALKLAFERREGKTQSEVRLLGIRFRSIVKFRTVPAASRRRERVQEAGQDGLQEGHRVQPVRREHPRRRLRLKPAAIRQVLPDALWLLKAARRWLKFDVRGDLVYGFSDPFTTAIAHQATAVMPSLLPELRLQPNYSQGTLRGRIELGVHVYPLVAVFVVARALFRPGVKSLWWPRLRDRILPRRIFRRNAAGQMAAQR